MVPPMIGGFGSSNDVVKALFGEDFIAGDGAAEEAVLQTCAQFEDLQRKVAVICRHCGVIDIDDAITQVAHAEALLEGLERAVGVKVDCLLDGVTHSGTTINCLTGQVSASSDQLSDIEQKLLVYEQIFARIREVIGNDEVANEDLPAIVAKSIEPYSFEPVPISIGKITHAIDGQLLDLALDTLRGKITGLDPDRIAMIREAA